jgi:radical SAM superfamily enzyme YgiQ (UPF0313 family)
MRQAGHTVTIINACVLLDSSLNQTAQRIEWQIADAIGFTGPVDVFAEVVWFVRRLRQDGYTGPIIYGNDFATLNAERILQYEPTIDYVARGEGEQTLLDLLEYIQGKRTLNDLKSVTLRTADGILSRPARSDAIDLDSLPRPSRDDLDRVLALGMSPGMFTKRGCQYRCAFCTTGHLASASGQTGRSAWRWKSAANAADEFLELADITHRRHITLVDDLFVGRDTLSREWAHSFAQALIAGNNKTTYMLDCRVDGVERELFAALRASGLRRVFMGVESGSDHVLRTLNKGARTDAAAKALQILSELDIEIVWGFINFTPFASRKDIELNLDFLSSLPEPHVELLLQELRVYPGTAMEAELRRTRLLRGEFPSFHAEYNDPQVASMAARARTIAAILANRAKSVKIADSPKQQRELFAWASQALFHGPVDVASIDLSINANA